MSIQNIVLQNTIDLPHAMQFFQQRKVQYLIQLNCFKCLKNIHLIDVGSNAGFYTKMALELLDVKYADMFEPVENLAKISYQLTEKDPVTLHRFGLGHEDKDIEIQLGMDGNIGWNTMVEGNWTPNMIKQAAKIKRFDGLGITPSTDTILVKIDTEGFEWSVLRGMREFNTKYRPYFHIEFGFGKGHPQLKEELEEFDYLKSLGYKVMGVGCGVIKDLSQVQGTEDILFLP